IRYFATIETSGLGAVGIFVQGDDAHIANYGSVVTHGDFYDPDPSVDGDEFFSEGIFAEGDRFYIANHGSVHVDGESSSGLVGVGAEGLGDNYGSVESLSDALGVVAAFGDGSRVVNAGGDRRRRRYRCVACSWRWSLRTQSRASP